MIKPGDILILARPNQEIFNIGLCEKNENDFKTIRIKWFDNFQPESIGIEKIRLAWFKFFGKELEIEISGKNMLLYGENGSGKTSLSDAIRFVAQTSITYGGIPLGDYSNIFSGENDDFLVKMQYCSLNHPGCGVS